MTHYASAPTERLLHSREKTLGFLASGREEFNPGPVTRLDHLELLCNKVLLKYKRDRDKCSDLVHWEDPEGSGGEGGRRGDWDGEHM